MSECPHCGSDGDHPSIGVDYWGDDEYRCTDCQGEWSDPSRYEADQLADVDKDNQDTNKETNA